MVSKGKTFTQMKRWAKKNKFSDMKIAYGTRTKKFHIIGFEDRDYNTSFAVSPLEFLEYETRVQAKRDLTRSRVVL